MSRRLRRLAIVAAAMAATCAILATLDAPVAGSSTPSAERRIEDAFCSVPEEIVVRTDRGYRPDRSGEIQYLTREPDFVGTSGLPHSGPWDYIADVPLVFYGPGHIAPRGEVSRDVTLADVAPTQAEILGFDRFHAPDGEALEEALLPGTGRRGPPKLLVTVIWDGAGDDVLDAFPDAWPVLRSIRKRGTWFSNAETGSSPPSTAQIHATIGTGAFTRTHGLVGHHFRVGDRMVTPWAFGPRLLMLPTLGDLYDRSMANRPVVGALGTVAIHLGMLGHGTAWGGGDRDVAVTREQENAETQVAEGVRWNLTRNVGRFYRFPTYANGLPGLPTYYEEADRLDGEADREWFGVPLWEGSVEQGFRTPARIPFQTRLVEEVIEREGFGADDTPDLLYINDKLIDEVGHAFTMNGPEMRSSIEAQDTDLGELVSFLDREVGKGDWVMALMADHGHTPDPLVSDARVIEPSRVAQVLQERFDTDGDDVPVIELVQPTQIWVDDDELAEQGHTLEEIATFLLDLKLGDVGSETWSVPAADAGDPAFMAAYPSTLLRTSTCAPKDPEAG